MDLHLSHRICVIVLFSKIRITYQASGFLKCFIFQIGMTEALSNILLQSDLGKLRHWAVNCQELDIQLLSELGVELKATSLV